MRRRPRPLLQAAHDDGIRSVAIVFMHGYRFPAHEQAAAELAREIGFTQISTSYETSPLMKLVSRGDTTVVDAYLSPLLRRYVRPGGGGAGRHAAHVHAVERGGSPTPRSSKAKTRS